MTLFVLFIVLMIERFFDWSHLRHWSWFSSYAIIVTRKVKVSSPYLIIVALLLPVVFILFVVDFLLSNALYGLVNLILSILVLLYCFGPQNLWADAYTSLNALAQDEPNVAMDKLKLTFNITNAPISIQALHKILLEYFFIACNVRVFAPVIFYIAFGVGGVVLYRLTALLATDTTQTYATPNVTLKAQTLLEVLDWVPVRILTFLFALGGHFIQVFTVWCQLVAEGINSNRKILIECGFKALADEVNNNIAEDGSAEKSAINLFDRSMIIMLVILSLVWLGF